MTVGSSLNLKSPSIVRPTNAPVCSLCISGYLSSVKEFDCEFMLKLTILDFSEFKIRLLFSFLILRLSIAFYVFPNLNCKFAPSVATVISSANSVTYTWRIFPGRSFIYIRKSAGPRTTDYRIVSGSGCFTGVLISLPSIGFYTFRRTWTKIKRFLNDVCACLYVCTDNHFFGLIFQDNYSIDGWVMPDRARWDERVDDWTGKSRPCQCQHLYIYLNYFIRTKIFYTFCS